MGHDGPRTNRLDFGGDPIPDFFEGYAIANVLLMYINSPEGASYPRYLAKSLRGCLCPPSASI